MHTHWIETLEFVQDFESSDDDEEETWKIQMTKQEGSVAIVGWLREERERVALL